MISAFGAQLACVNGANRPLFAIGRECRWRSQARNFLVRTDPAARVADRSPGDRGHRELGEPTRLQLRAQALRALVIIVTHGAYLILLAYF